MVTADREGMVMRQRFAMGAALLLAAMPAAAQISFSNGVMDILGDGGTGGVLGPGAQGNSFNFADFSACDQNEAFCQTQPYGGRYANGGYSISITNSTLSYRFDLWQGTDVGGPLENQFELLAFFISDRPVRTTVTGSSSVTLENGCTSCTRSFGLGQASTERRPDGRWDVVFLASMFAGASNGGQRLQQQGSLSISAVPEPASWAMLIAGFGLVGAAQRRRRHCAV